MALPLRLVSSSHRRSGQADPVVYGVAICLAALGLAGAWWFLGGGDDAVLEESFVHRVGYDDFLLEITERGEVESSDVVEVRCLVKSKNTQGTAILKVVPEGTTVTKGQFLVQLDSSALETERTNQQILVYTAQAVRIQAEYAQRLAKIAKLEYEEGTFVELEMTVESEIFVAEENLSRAREYLKYSERLAAKGHITEHQLEADAFAVEKAAKDLEVATTKLDVLRRFTKMKMLQQLDSDIATTKAKWDADRNSYELEVTKLKEIDDQISKCRIVAPADGTVLYVHDRDGRGNDEFVIEEGAVARENQALIRLPNQLRMRVEVKVNEALVKYVAAGQTAAILPMGFEKPLMGHVERVNQYAEPQNWRKPDVREYLTFVTVDETSPNLRSGMSAQVTIQCVYLPSVLQIPVQAAYAHGKKYYCFVKSGSSWKAKEVHRGPTNDRFFVVESGLEEGEEVALAPRKIRDQVELPSIAVEDQQSVVRNVPIPESERVVRGVAEKQPRVGGGQGGRAREGAGEAGGGNPGGQRPAASATANQTPSHAKTQSPAGGGE